MSTDNTAETVRGYADLFPEVQISYIPYRRPNVGWSNPAIPRNMGIRFTNPNHELIVFSEPEMLWTQDVLKTFCEWFENPPATLPKDPYKDWIPPEPIHDRFFLTASHVAYCPDDQALGNNDGRDPMSVFGHHTVDRRWPEINTRVAAVLRKDVFNVRGWDERFQGWGYDDTDFMNRLQMSGCKHIPLMIPVIHTHHEYPPATGSTAQHNLELMQESHRNGIIAPNGDDWGGKVKREKFGTEISHDLWNQIQSEELASWTDKAWPSRSGKLLRERKYLTQAAIDLDLDNLVDPSIDGVAVDFGCGPLSILEVVNNNLQKIAIDPLHEGYEAIRNWEHESVTYMYGRGEDYKSKLPIRLITSINGIDHYENPYKTLVNMVSLLTKGGFIALHYCINNASEGHPHPAHRIDLDSETMLAWGKELGLTVVSAKEVPYGWRHQLSAAIVFQK